MSGISEKSSRLAWPDAARGMAVLAVVLYHTLIWNHIELTGDLNGVWGYMNAALSRLRMPVLLGLSGMFAARGLLLGWRSGSAARRFVANYYLYAVWLIIYFIFYVVVQEPNLHGAVNGANELARNFLLPGTTLWYILGLALFPLTIAAAVAIQIPGRFVMLLALGVWAVGTYIPMEDSIGKLLRTFIFFAIGVYCSGKLRKMANLPWGRALLLGVIFIALVVGQQSTRDHWTGSVVGLTASIIAIPATFGLVARLCDWGPFARFGSAVGKRTLAIYLMHVPLLGIVLMIIRASSPLQAFGQTPVGDFALPIASASVVIALSLSANKLLAKLPGDFLRTLPPTFDKRLRERLGSSGSRIDAEVKK